MPVIDFSNVKDNVIDPGEYTVTLTASEYVAESKSSKKPYMKFEMTVSDEENTAFNGRKVFRNFSLQPQSLFAIKQAMIAFDADADIFEDPSGLDLEEEVRSLYGNQAIVVITNEEFDGRMQNRVGKIKSTSSF